MAEAFLVKKFSNGLTLLGEQMADVESTAMVFVLPGGSSCDPAGGAGAASVAAEWLLRGAGDRDSRALNDALDALGCQHNASVNSESIQLSAAQLGTNLSEVLEIYADILCRPQLAGETFDPCRQLIAQDMAAMEDEPAQKCNAMLREQFFPFPLGRIPYGTAESLAAMTEESLRHHIGPLLTPNGAVLAVAGAFDEKALLALVEKLFGDWSGQAPAPADISHEKVYQHHVHKETNQTHIGLAYPAVPANDDRSYPARVAETVLSRGMGSRLFTQVREKRGLAYHVSCSYVSLREYAGMFAYAGTRPDLAPKTLEVTIAELRRLTEGIDDEELSRAKTQLRSSLVMGEQSTLARANTLASDWIHRGRLRTLEEISRRVQAVTEKGVLDYLTEFPPEEFTLLTIGPEPLTISEDA